MMLSWKYIFYLVGVASIGGVLAYSYHQGKMACEEEYALEMAKLTVGLIDRIKEKDAVNRELERRVLEKEIVVEEKVVEIIKEIPKYITVDKCRVNDTGVRHIRGRVTDLFPTAK